MEFIRNTFEFHIQEPCVVSLGKFDGLHMGHKKLMEKMNEGKSRGLKSVALTFEIPPRALENKEYKILSTNQEKEKILAAAGIDVLIELPFNDRLKNTSPEDFLKLLTERINIKMIVAGTDFRFGHNRAGDYHTLQKYEDVFEYSCCVVKKLQSGGADISSTRIRGLVEQGNIEEANRLLGYSYFVSAEVEHGEGLGGKELYPTANMRPAPEKLLPPFGVYVSAIKIDGKIYHSVTNVGKKPTIGEFPAGLETYILDFDGDIYGKVLDVFFCHFVRPEMKFHSLEELKAQMEKDLEIVKKFDYGKAQNFI